MDEATIDRLARRAGGRFKLTTLVMKRLVEINRGSQLLVEHKGGKTIYDVLKEADLEVIRLIPRLPAPQESPEDSDAAAEED